MTNHKGERLTTHAQCYHQGFDDASKVLAQKWHDIGFNKGWIAAQNIYEKNLAALQTKLDAIEAERKQELDALAAWSDVKMQEFGM